MSNTKRSICDCLFTPFPPHIHYMIIKIGDIKNDIDLIINSIFNYVAVGFFC